ncbi:MAG: hypothetical protein L6Q37_09945 [Bdellovibrionaceae bacterium]|nr:hypothetical protein [Pseudobdellovibrionaceae bacterium]NUM59735.1 hypothetical protein [Pseudobdellovibrionaceae bacterium]
MELKKNQLGFAKLKSVIFLFSFLFLASLSAQTKAEGTGSLGGGGNGDQTGVFESSIKAVTSLAAYPKYIKPVLDRFDFLMNQLNSEKRKEESFSYSTFLIKWKLWYFTKSNLNMIDKKTLGVVFLSDTPYQIAINTPREIWINRDFFFDLLGRDLKTGIIDPELQLRKQADLIIHEIVMNLYFLRYQSFYEICKLSEELGFQNADKKNLSCEQLKELKIFKQKEEMVLTEEDYQRIRRVTDFFINDMQAATSEQLYSKLINNGFDKRFINKKEQAPKQEKITYEAVVKTFQKMILAENFDEKCLVGNEKNPELCKLFFKQYKDSKGKLYFDLSLHLTKQAQNFNFRIHRSQFSQYPYTYGNVSGRQDIEVIFNNIGITNSNVYQVGDKFQTITLIFESKKTFFTTQDKDETTFELIGFYIQNQVIASVKPIEGMDPAYYQNSLCQSYILNPNKYPIIYSYSDPIALDILELNQKIFYEQSFPCSNKSAEFLKNEEKIKKYLKPLINKTFFNERELNSNGTSLENLQTNIVYANLLQLQQGNKQACENIKKSQPEINKCVFIEKITFLPDLSVRLNDKYLCGIGQLKGIKNNVKSTSFQSIRLSDFVIFLDCSNENFSKNVSFLNSFNGEIEINKDGFDLINLYKSQDGYFKNTKQFKLSL